MRRTEQVVYPPSELPVLFQGDAVVFGGSLAGIAAALRLAGAGRSVALVEPRTYLGREIAATLRPWLPVDRHKARPEPIGSFLARLEAESPEEAGAGPETELPFALDSLKLHLEDSLLAAGVKLLYASLPVAICRGSGGVEGVVIGNKSGRQFLGCTVLIDASETALAARLVGETPAESRPHGSVVALTLEFDGVTEPLTGHLAVPAGLNLVGSSVRLRRGYRGSRHLLVECVFPVEAVGTGSFPRTADGAAREEVRARELVMEVAVHLMANVPAFAGAYLAASSHETLGPLALRGSGEPPAWVGNPSASLAGAVRGLWHLSQAQDDATGGFADPVLACRLGEELAERLAGDWPSASGLATGAAFDGPSPATGGEATEAETAGGGMTHGEAIRSAATRGKATGAAAIREPASPQRSRPYPTRRVPGMALPPLLHADVLVIGGGTSGATAAAAAASEGLATVLVEMNPGLGGTGTYGGVNDYWFGRRVGFADRLNASVGAFHACLGHEFPDSEVPRWNIEAKAHVLMRSALRSGVEVLLNSFVIASIVDGSTVRGVVVATRFGPAALLGEVVIDATGDGDVAAFAGAAHVYGSQREHVTMWYSLAQFGLPGHTRNNFTSTVDVGNVEDYTRAVLAGRRRKRSEGAIHDHGIYLAPRESRHILGEVVLTLTDQLLKRSWPDVVSVAFSNNDVKGHTTSDWVRLGLISPNLEVEIPYRAIVPRDLENILVVGKAISATHDALPAIRMQADLENLGGVAALAAAQALRSGRRVRDIDVALLQRRLVDEGVLPASLPGRELTPWQPGEDELRELVASLSADRPLHAYSDMKIGDVCRERIPLVDICCAGAHAVPLLSEALAVAEGDRRTLLAQALAILGSPAGVPELISAIDVRLAHGQLPPRASGIRHAVAPPDQGAMPEVVYLIHALGMTRDKRALPVWRRVVDLLEGVSEADIRDASRDVFDYVDAVCLGAERLADPAALPILEKLHGYPPFRGQASRERYQADYFRERQAFLELLIGRSIARCGGAHGLAMLCEYLEDSRALLAEHAHSELVAITGNDLGKDGASWRAWLAESCRHLQPSPWCAPTDPVASWGEEILMETVAAAAPQNPPRSSTKRSASPS
jgi:flavin-dependent dehydrogenase